MTKIELKPKAKKFIESLPPKHQRQIKNYILSMKDNVHPHDARPLIGYEDYFRTDVGEYRIIYRYANKQDVITIVLVGKRNDGEIYRLAKRALN